MPLAVVLAKAQVYIPRSNGGHIVAPPHLLLGGGLQSHITRGMDGGMDKIEDIFVINRCLRRILFICI